MCLQRRFSPNLARGQGRGGVQCHTFGLAAVAALPMYLSKGRMIRHIGAGAAVIGKCAHSMGKNSTCINFTEPGTRYCNKANVDFHCRRPYIGPLGVSEPCWQSFTFAGLTLFCVSGCAFVIISLYGLAFRLWDQSWICLCQFFASHFINQIERRGGISFSS